MRRISASICLVTAGAGFYLLRAATLQSAPQEASKARLSSRPRRSGSTKSTWHSGPASTPPETEVVPPPPPNPPPVTSPILESQEERNKLAAPNPGAVSPAGSVVTTNRASQAAREPAPTANANPHDYSNAPDPETLRIRDELQRLRDDINARRAFYDELHHTVEHVRADMRDEDSPEKNAAPPHPASPASHDASPGPSNQTANPPADPLGASKPHDSQPQSSGGPQASVSTSGGSIDRTAYLRVVRWAQSNGAPVPLALGVAWIESRLHTDPPLGNAGEVGMFQIMPARCRIEGWPSRRLNEPEFNAWLGTRLLARYYQEEGSWARAAAKYVAGPRVFDKSYSKDVWAYINWYASSVNSYAGYFSRYQS